jgi:K+-sensing histidine kinase KdpD
MKKKKDYRPKTTKLPEKTIPKSIGNKLAVLLGVIIPIAALIAYSMDRNFFSITIIISIFILIISIAAYVKGEVIYSHPKVVHHVNTPINKKAVVHKKYNTNFSFSLNKGTVQVVLSMMIIIVCAFLGQVISKL